MTAFRALVLSEARLLLRDPVTWLAAVVLPSVVLLLFGGVFGNDPDPALGGRRWIEMFVPSLVVITVGTLGIQTLPVRLATYREKGVLRRLGPRRSTLRRCLPPSSCCMRRPRSWRSCS